MTWAWAIRVWISCVPSGLRSSRSAPTWCTTRSSTGSQPSSSSAWRPWRRHSRPWSSLKGSGRGGRWTPRGRRASIGCRAKPPRLTFCPARRSRSACLASRSHGTRPSQSIGRRAAHFLSHQRVKRAHLTPSAHGRKTPSAAYAHGHARLISLVHACMDASLS